MKHQTYLHDKELNLSYSNRDRITSDRLDQTEKASKVLIVTITNIKLPVTADVLQTVFYKYGEVNRIICFPRQLGY
jgi:hypothetical protein